MYTLQIESWVYTLNSKHCQQKTPALFLSICPSKTVMEQFGAFTVTSTFLSLHITTAASTWQTGSALSPLLLTSNAASTSGIKQAACLSPWLEQ